MEARKFTSTGPPARAIPLLDPAPALHTSAIGVDGRSGLKAHGLVPAVNGGLPTLPPFTHHFAETTVTLVHAHDAAARAALADALTLACPPDSGSLHFGTTNLARMDPETACRWRRRNVRFVPATDRLVPRHTIMQALQQAAAEGEPQIAIPRAVTLLERLGLSRRLAVRAEMLTPADRKVVALVQALCVAPRMVVLDDPTAGMPPILATKIARTLRHYARGRRAVVICLSDDPAIEELADVSIRYMPA